MNSYRGKHNHRSRRLAELVLDFSLLNGLIAAWSYRCGLHGKLGVTPHDVFVAKEKSLRVPLIIAFASGLHAGPTTHPESFSKLFAKLSDIRPQVLLLGVAVVSRHAIYLDALPDGLSPCNPPVGTYA